MIILPEDRNIVELLSPEDAQMLLLALFSDDDIPTVLSATANLAYTVIKSKSERLLKGRDAFLLKQSERGKKGGAPTGNQNANKQPKTTQNNLNNPKQPETSQTGTGTDTVTGNNTVTNTVTKKETKNLTPALPILESNETKNDGSILSNLVTKETKDAASALPVLESNEAKNLTPVPPIPKQNSSTKGRDTLAQTTLEQQTPPRFPPSSPPSQNATGNSRGIRRPQLDTTKL